MIARGLVALLVLFVSACATVSDTPSASVTTIEPVWPEYFTLRWSLTPANAGWQRIDGYVYNSSTSYPADRMQLLAQALDASGSVVGQRLEWVTSVVPPSGRSYFTVGALPPANVYRVSVWRWEFLQAGGSGPARP
jgi:hypothetical protein